MKRVVAAFGVAWACVVACSSSTTGTGASTNADAGGEAPETGSSESPPSDSGATDATASGRVSLDANATCARLTTCEEDAAPRDGGALPLADCLLFFPTLAVTPACLNAMASASCADLNADHGPTETFCFPPCSSPGTQKCNGDGTITVCNATLGTVVLDCGRTCASTKQTWTGACGASYGGKTDPTDKCWCQ